MEQVCHRPAPLLTRVRNMTNQLKASEPPLYAAHDCTGRVACPSWHRRQDREEVEQEILFRLETLKGQWCLKVCHNAVAAGAKGSLNLTPVDSSPLWLVCLRQIVRMRSGENLLPLRGRAGLSALGVSQGSSECVVQLPSDCVVQPHCEFAGGLSVCCALVKWQHLW